MRTTILVESTDTIVRLRTEVTQEQDHGRPEMTMALGLIDCSSPLAGPQRATDITALHPLSDGGEQAGTKGAGDRAIRKYSQIPTGRGARRP
ncbi:MAG: hypothetical protein K2X52_17275 [Mycobacteriaceae bacterium]|nr:hypothetical protein [Mycolicibacterium sp. GF69]MBY0288871.1 hypothetical protein [Mycobacteriaceae bacterium]